MLVLNRTDRVANFHENQAIVPDLIRFAATDTDDVVTQFLDLHVRYENQGFKRLGMLANTVTKTLAFRFQLMHNIDYVVYLEDDVILTNKSFVTEACKSKHRDRDLNRHGKWGEIYGTTINGATRVIESICKKGIYKNIDNQLNDLFGKIHHIPHWTLRTKTNQGHISKSQAYSASELKARSRNLTC